MLHQMTGFFTSAFVFPGLKWGMALVAVALGIAFGAVWLSGFWPPLIKKPALWLVAVTSAFITWTAIAFIQIPLQSWTGQALLLAWNQTTLTQWLLLAAIPQILLSGLVQEATKLLPLLYFRWRGNLTSPESGLIMGAVSGAGFGVFEAIWVHNTILASGWSWSLVAIHGFPALLGFVERFTSIGLHISVSALAGYGLATHRGWRFYFIASALHGLTNYAVVLIQKGVLSGTGAEIYIGVITPIVAGVALWLRWRKNGSQSETSVSA
jgi:hypothetical protein